MSSICRQVLSRNSTRYSSSIRFYRLSYDSGVVVTEEVTP